ncbi:MAG: flavodoxin family protein [Lentisphaeria bacterium]|nr:flavodoxin family protein [Lentisphaeria bacterium]
MPKKMLFVIAGPRLAGSTAFAARTAAEAARAAGNEVDIVELPKLKGGNVGCISCYGCQRSGEYRCVIDDDMSRLVASLPQYDVVAIASPVFFFSISAQAKAFLDRFFSLVKHVGDGIETPLSKIRLAFITTSGGDESDSGVRNVFSTIRDCAAYAEAPEPQFLYFGNCTEPKEFKADRANTEKAAAFGRAL